MKARTLCVAWLAGASCLAAQSPWDLENTGDITTGKLNPEWSWLREDPAGWKLIRGVLQVRTNGNLWEEENTQRNLLLREVPAGDAAVYAVEVTVSNQADLTERYEHGGLIWYWDDDNWVTLTQLNHVQHKTQKIMLVHETGGDGRAQDSHAEPYTPSRVDLRLIVEGGVFTGFYRRSGKHPWQRLGAITFPGITGSPRVGLTAGGGPEDAAHWITFDDFSLRRLTASDD